VIFISAAPTLWSSVLQLNACLCSRYLDLYKSPEVTLFMTVFGTLAKSLPASWEIAAVKKRSGADGRQRERDFPIIYRSSSPCDARAWIF